MIKCQKCSICYSGSSLDYQCPCGVFFHRECIWEHPHSPCPGCGRCFVTEKKTSKVVRWNWKKILAGTDVAGTIFYNLLLIGSGPYLFGKSILADGGIVFAIMISFLFFTFAFGYFPGTIPFCAIRTIPKGQRRPHRCIYWGVTTMIFFLIIPSHLIGGRVNQRIFGESHYFTYKSGLIGLLTLALSEFILVMIGLYIWGVGWRCRRSEIETDLGEIKGNLKKCVICGAKCSKKCRHCQAGYHRSCLLKSSKSRCSECQESLVIRKEIRRNSLIYREVAIFSLDTLVSLIYNLSLFGLPPFLLGKTIYLQPSSNFLYFLYLVLWALSGWLPFGIPWWISIKSSTRKRKVGGLITFLMAVVVSTLHSVGRIVGQGLFDLKSKDFLTWKTGTVGLLTNISAISILLTIGSVLYCLFTARRKETRVQYQIRPVEIE